MIVSVRHDQREKPNNLKLVQRTKVLIHNQLADKAKARLPTFLHNLHLVVCYIFLILNNIHQITTCRLFDSIQFCVVPFFVTHRIFLWAPLLLLLIVISQNVILSGKPHTFLDKLFKINNVSVETCHPADKLWKNVIWRLLARRLDTILKKNITYAACSWGNESLLAEDNRIEESDEKTR